MATIPSSWPSTKLEQNNTIQQIENALFELEVRVKVPTIHSETEPTITQLENVIGRDFGLAAALPNYTKIAWWQPSINGIKNILVRVVDLPGGLASGTVYKMCPEMPVFAAVLDYQLLDVDTASFQSINMSQDYEYLLVVSTHRTSQAVGSVNSQIRWDNQSAASYNLQQLIVSRLSVIATEVDGETFQRWLNIGTTNDLRSWARVLCLLRDYAKTGKEQAALQYSNYGDGASLTDRSARFASTPLQLNSPIDLINWEAGTGNWLAKSRFLVIGLGKVGV